MQLFKKTKQTIIKMLQAKLFTRTAVAPRSAQFVATRGFANQSKQTGQYNKNINPKLSEEILSKKIKQVVDKAEDAVSIFFHYQLIPRFPTTLPRLTPL
jgi:ribosomal protein L31E